jgi:hypothetical protein|tara:strand:+ start:255 stop:455 length:201 start_codon:yes stop_codon:yes gene_type:complete
MQVHLVFIFRDNEREEYVDCLTIGGFVLNFDFGRYEADLDATNRLTTMWYRDPVADTSAAKSLSGE